MPIEACTVKSSALHAYNVQSCEGFSSGHFEQHASLCRNTSICQSNENLGCFAAGVGGRRAAAGAGRAARGGLGRPQLGRRRHGGPRARAHAQRAPSVPLWFKTSLVRSRRRAFYAQGSGRGFRGVFQGFRVARGGLGRPQLGRRQHRGTRALLPMLSVRFFILYFPGF